MIEPKHTVAPRVAGDAESFLRAQAQRFREAAAVEARDGAGLNRIGLTLRVAAFYAEGADALAIAAMLA